MGNVCDTLPRSTAETLNTPHALSTNGHTQGAKANMKRERNAKNAKGEAKSQTKTNEKAMSIQCQTCKQTFLQTTKAPALLEHASNKHKKGLADCFPGVSV